METKITVEINGKFITTSILVAEKSISISGKDYRACQWSNGTRFAISQAALNRMVAAGDEIERLLDEAFA